MRRTAARSESEGLDGDVDARVLGQVEAEDVLHHRPVVLLEKERAPAVHTAPVLQQQETKVRFHLPN